MWTPKRIALLMAGVVVFCTSYVGYARSHLGTIDGLPTLPVEFRKEETEIRIAPPRPRTSRVEDKLKLAFGQECKELKHPIKLEMHARNMALAAGMAKFDDDGRVFLSPVSVAMFGKVQNDGRGVEINTVTADSAWLTFDRPVFSPQDVNGRKIVGAELRGNIQLVNNRRTPERTDDLFLYINNGPLYYSETKHLLWTDDKIYVRDQQSTPKPIEVRGTGMDVELIPDAPPAKPGTGTPAVARKQKKESISGVKSITLRSYVEMYLYVDSNRSGLPGNDRAPAKSAKPAAKDAPPKNPADDEKALVIIKTPGPFRYDFNKDQDTATFDLPAADPLHPPTSPDDLAVHVHRHMPKLNTDDHLYCKHLELKMRRKEPAAATTGRPQQPAAERSSPSQGLDIEMARATGGYHEVILTSDTEKLTAEGNEFIHDARKLRTILRDTPELKADRDGSIIYCPELLIQDEKLPDAPTPGDPKAANKAPGKAPPKSVQRVTATGPGRIDLWDKVKEQSLDHASWTEGLNSSRDGGLDLLVLTGSARFWNDGPGTTDQRFFAGMLAGVVGRIWYDEQGSTLQGDTLKVWMRPREPEAEPTARSQPAAAPAPRPERIEAIGNVFSKSRELIVHETSHLTILFKDAPPSALPQGPPDPIVAPSAAAPSVNPVVKGGDTVPTTSPPPPGREQAPAPIAERPKPAPAKAEEPARPMDLSARTVDATVLRGEDPVTRESKNTLEKLWCTGRVHVRQDADPTNPEDKGIDIKGSTLRLDWRPEGNLLTVAADDKGSPNEEDLAQMLVRNLYIIGPEINVDQRDDRVWVNGSGAMMMESATTLNGVKKPQPVPLTIHWTKSMLFIGKSVMYQGEIQAEQDNGRMTCEALTVFFDRPISLKQPPKKTGKAGKVEEEKPPRVETMICDRKVLIEEATADVDPKTNMPRLDKKTGKPRLAKYEKVSGTTVNVEANEKEPGELKDTNKLRAAGPGAVWLYQRGGAADPLAPPADPARPKPAPKPADDDDEMKLTYVEFGKSMLANNKTGKSNFWGGVRALNMPGDDPTLEINLDEMMVQLPKGALYLTAEQLEVLGQKLPNGKTNQQMTATRRVYVKANEFEANCEKLCFDESKDQVIFYGNENGRATLIRQPKKGVKPEVIKGKEIIYIRSTGEFKVDGSDFIGN